MPKERIKDLIISVHIPLFISQVFFSLLPTLSKIVFREVEPEFFVAIRITASALLFILITKLIRLNIKFSFKEHLTLFILAFLGITGNQFFFLKGVSLTKATNAVISITLIPIFTYFFSVVMKREKFTLLKTAGVISGLIGVSFILLKSLENLRIDTGVFLIIINSTFYSLYLVFSKPILKTFSPISVITLVFTYGAVQSQAILFFFYPQKINLHFSFKTSLVMLFIIIFSTVLTYFINIFILKKAVPSLVGAYTYLQPVLGAFFAYLILNELPGIKQFLSFLFIGFGLYLISIRNE